MRLPIGSPQKLMGASVDDLASQVALLQAERMANGLALEKLTARVSTLTACLSDAVACRRVPEFYRRRWGAILKSDL